MNSNGLKALVRKGIHASGFQITRFNAETSEARRLQATLQHFGINLVIDVGANTGQFGGMVRDAGFTDRIVSFEPLEDAHRALSARAASDPNWTVHDRGAVGDTQGEIKINVAGNSVSSSVLAMLPTLAEAAPQSKYTSSLLTPIITLDSVADRYIGAKDKVFLKIDTQGYERQVLDGALSTLNRTTLIQLELSLVPLYDGQMLWEYFVERLKNLGFEIWSLIPAFSNPDTGQMLQIDVVFSRANNTSNR